MQKISLNVDRTKAILIGVGDYTYLQKVPPADNNIQDVKDVLQDPRFLGLTDQNILLIQNKRNDEIIDAIIEFINDEDQTDLETLILYYIGHGIRSNSSKDFYLTGSNSKPSSVSTSAIPYNEVKYLIENSQIQNRIIIIDACHSGLATLGDEVLTEDELDIKGSYTLTSSAGDEKSFFDASLRNTFFTKELLEVIKSGSPHESPFITLENIYTGIKKKSTRTAPQRKSNLNASEFYIFRNLQFNPLKQEEKRADDLAEQLQYQDALFIYLKLHHGNPSAELSAKIRNCEASIELIEKLKRKEQEKAAKEKEIAEQAERDRIEKERLEAEARSNQERLEREKAEADERLKQEKAEKEKAEADRLYQLQLEKLRTQLEEEERLKQEKLKQEEEAEKERLKQEELRLAKKAADLLELAENNPQNDNKPYTPPPFIPPGLEALKARWWQFLWLLIPLIGGILYVLDQTNATNLTDKNTIDSVTVIQADRDELIKTSDSINTLYQNELAKKREDSIRKARVSTANIIPSVQKNRSAESSASKQKVVDTKTEIPRPVPAVVPSRYDDIYFKFSNTTINTSSYTTLDRIASDMKSSSFRIELTGFAAKNDTDGEDDLQLSKERANSIKTYLVNQGVDAGRIRTRGLGTIDPRGNNLTEEGRSLNRRVECRVIK